MHTAFNLQKPLAFMAFMAFIACNRSLFGERSKLPTSTKHANTCRYLAVAGGLLQDCFEI